MNKPLVSIVIPHRPDRIIMYMKTIRDQTYGNIEIIIETDEHMEGAPRMRNRGAAKAKGDFLFFCDDDIELKLDCIEKLYNALIANKRASWAYCSYDKTGALSGTEESLPWDAGYLKKRNYISTMSLVYATVFRQVKFDEGLKRYQDWDLWLSLSLYGYEGVQVPEVLFTAHYEDVGISLAGPESRVANTNILMAKHGLSDKKLAIIIPVHNQLHMTIKCLQSITRNTVGDYHIIVVDDGSTDDMNTVAQPGGWHYKYNYIHLDKPHGHTHCVNIGVEAAPKDCQYICLLNNDTLVSHFWNTKLMSALDSKPRASCVGPMTSKAASIQEVRAYAEVRNIMNASNINLLQCDLERRIKPATIVAKATGFCLMTTRDKWEMLGPFDPNIKSGGNEAEWIIRGLKRGVFPTIRTDTYVHHYGGQSYVGQKRSSEWEAGQDYIREKHGQKYLDFLEKELFLKLKRKM